MGVGIHCRTFALRLIATERSTQGNGIEFHSLNTTEQQEPPLIFIIICFYFPSVTVFYSLVHQTKNYLIYTAQRHQFIMAPNTWSSCNTFFIYIFLFINFGAIRLVMFSLPYISSFTKYFRYDVITIRHKYRIFYKSTNISIVTN